MCTYRLRGASRQQLLIKFLIQIGEKYSTRGACVEYMIDLLHLDVPLFLEVQQKQDGPDSDDAKAVEEFKLKMRDFAQTKCNRVKLWHRMSDINVSCIFLL